MNEMNNDDNILSNVKITRGDFIINIHSNWDELTKRDWLQLLEVNIIIIIINNIYIISFII